jgi:hypothetical protein
MNPRNLLGSRFVALGAGVLLGALSVTLVAAATARPSPRQGTGGTGGGTGDDGAQVFRASGPTMPALPAFGTSDSNGQMIAVTGIDVTGSSILYLIDTKGRHLAVYQANGGTESTQGLRLVGARRIDLDLELEGYFDKSEYRYRDLQKQFSGLPKAASGPAK